MNAYVCVRLRWGAAGAQAVCEKESVIQWEYLNMSMLDSSCVYACVCQLHPQNSSMLKVIGLHSELWYSCINQLSTKPPYPHSEPHNKGLKQYPL